MRISAFVCAAVMCVLCSSAAYSQVCGEETFFPTSPQFLAEDLQEAFLPRFPTEDYNGDGIADVLRVSKRSPMTLTVYAGLSDGAGGYLTNNYEIATSNDLYFYSSTTAPRDEWAVDFTGDGRLDMVIEARLSDSFSERFLVVFDLASGSPVKILEQAIGAYYVVDMGDINNDGFADLLLDDMDRETVNTNVRLNNKAGGFLDPLPITYPNFSHGFDGLPRGPMSKVIDMDGDGNLDIVAGLRSVPAGNAMYVFYGDGTGEYEFTGPERYYLPSIIGDLSVTYADLNADGFKDIVCTLEHNVIGVVLSDGTGGWGALVRYEITMYFTGSVRRPTVQDVNGDAVLDIVLVAPYHTIFDSKTPHNSSLVTLLGHPDGTFEPEIIYYNSGWPLGVPFHGRHGLYMANSLVASDLDGDGVDEFLVSVYDRTCDESDPCYGPRYAIVRPVCRQPRPGDFEDDGITGVTDLARVLASWGGTGGDLNGDGVTNATDLAIVIADWGRDY